MRVYLSRALNPAEIAAPMSVLMVLASGMLTKLGHTGWGVAVLIGFCLLCGIAERLFRNAAARPGASDVGQPGAASL